MAVLRGVRADFGARPRAGEIRAVRVGGMGPFCGRILMVWNCGITLPHRALRCVWWTASLWNCGAAGDWRCIGMTLITNVILTTELADYLDRQVLAIRQRNGISLNRSKLLRGILAGVKS